jgi:ribosome-binding factor A
VDERKWGGEDGHETSMSSRRTAKIAEAIREVVSTSILFEVRDPRVRNVTVLGVSVPGDLRSAKVAVSVLGDETEQRLCLHGLESSRGFLQKRIADRLDLRWTPVLTFELDDGIKKSIEASRILRELEARDAGGESEEPVAGVDSEDELNAADSASEEE